MTKRIDQNDTEHVYAYDRLGRLSQQSVNISDSSVDGRVQRMATTYNVQGLPATITSYSSTSDATAIDQVTRQYNDFGMLVYEYQAHQGTQSGSTPYVEYTYDRTLDNQFPVQEFVKGLRPVNIYYPDRTPGANNSYSYHYNDPGTADDRLNRPIAVVYQQVDSFIPVVTEYKYLGLGTVVETTHHDALSPPTLSWKLAADCIRNDLCDGSAKGDCCNKQVVAEQTGLEECKETCGQYQTKSWGGPFDIPGPPWVQDIGNYLQQLEGIGVELPQGFKGDFNNLQDRIRFGQEACGCRTKTG